MKKKIVKRPATKAKTTILDKIKVDNVIRAKFNITNLQMDKSLRWQMRLAVQRRLSKSYSDYRMEMVFDDEPFKKQIDDIERKIQELQSEADGQLFKDNARTDINFQKERIAAIMDDRDAKQRECRKIETYAEVANLKYSRGWSILTVYIPDLVIPDINDRKSWFTYYRLELTPAEVSEPARGMEDDDDQE